MKATKTLFLAIIFLLVSISGVYASCGSGCCNCTTYTVNGTYIITENNITNRTESVWVEGNFTKTDCVGVGDSHIDAMVWGLLGIIAFLIILWLKLDDSHKIFKTFLILFTIYLTAMIPRVLNSVIATAFSWDFMKYYLLFLKIFGWYLLFYFIWSIADYYQKTTPLKQWFNDNFKNKGGR